MLIPTYVLLSLSVTFPCGIVDAQIFFDGQTHHGQLGIALAFPPPFFSVQSYGLYVADVRGGIFTRYKATCYVSKHTMVYDEGE